MLANVDNLFLDEKYLDFLLLAEAENGSCRHYSFRIEDSFNGIIDVEDIPLNYPRLSISSVTVERLREIKAKLVELGWTLIVDRVP